MANDVLLKLANKLKELPVQVEDALISATKQAVDETFDKLVVNLKKGAGYMSKLTSHIQILPVIDNDRVYKKEVDWDNTKIVNEDVLGKGIEYPTIYADKPRLRGKRNYSKVPATYHDLAYIIDDGHVAKFSTTGFKVVQGTNFIKRARRNAKVWRKKRDIYATVNLDMVAKQLDKE